MSLSSILNTAQSGLAAAQTQLQVVSGNVTNVDTPGYVTEVANQVSTATGGVGTGVEISSIQLAVNNFLQTASQQANAAAGSADALQQYYDQVQQLFGDPSASTTSTSSTASTDFFSTISQAFASFSTLAQNPTSTHLSAGSRSATCSRCSRRRPPSIPGSSRPGARRTRRSLPT